MNQSNKFIIGLFSGLCILYSQPSFAWDYSATGATTEQSVQLRTGVEFSKKWNNGLQLGLSEVLRFDLFDQLSGTTAKSESADSTLGAAFNRSYATLSLAYAHPQFSYVKVDAGYTLRLYGRKGWSDANEFLRHRVFFGLTGTYKTDFAKIYLRERIV